MSEELNDNLPVNENAVDGNVENQSPEVVETENQEVEVLTADRIFLIMKKEYR